ncbi:MAG: orotidine-5'-phosphate decarboxylase [Hyphomicrobiaceae bacterium]
MSHNPIDSLIVALDFPTTDEAHSLVETLGEDVQFYKVGLELLFAGGLHYAQTLKQQGKNVFLDMKLLDIANTVEKAVANVAGFGFDMLTIHGTDRKTMDAAVKGRGNSNLKLLAVTVLTSLDDHDLKEQGSRMDPQELVLHRAQLARDAGMDGIVASGQEANAVRDIVGPDMLVVTPGIRLAGAASDDQARIITPERAISAGASHLVVGRPISRAEDPASAARTFQAEMAKAHT